MSTTQPAKTRPGLAIALVVILASAGWLAFAGLRPYVDEPRYEGKRLSEWLRGLDGQSAEFRAQAVEAIRAMGTNVLPRLEAMIHAEDSRWKQALVELASVQPDLRLNAHPAFQQRWWAVRALPAVGPEAVEPLVKALQHHDRLVRMGAALGLGELQARPDLAVPALTASVQDRRSEIAMYAAEALASFGDQARVAVPVLIEALERTDSHVRSRIAGALEKIDPEAAPFL